MEQNAVAILWSLLAVGIKNIYVGPAVPAWVNQDILRVLTEQYGVKVISTPDADIKKMMGLGDTTYF
jgi:hydroxylamine reductase